MEHSNWVKLACGKMPILKNPLRYETSLIGIDGYRMHAIRNLPYVTPHLLDESNTEDISNYPRYDILYKGLAVKLANIIITPQHVKKLKALTKICDAASLIFEPELNSVKVIGTNLHTSLDDSVTIADIETDTFDRRSGYMGITGWLPSKHLADLLDIKSRIPAEWGIFSDTNKAGASRYLFRHGDLEAIVARAE